ncbi:MAG: 1-deoxy-D-xylulose-5-phosphate synthase [Solobacterium sp.]|nr:1-deoxy-D-xylulose-5-phosphate synthase [Solobacterium sp.]
MDLTNIQDPTFLKTLSISELNELAQEIRTFLVQSISKTGGHLASNLGVVELTIALHYCFNSPTDKIFFDVGHQCYTHKILTGRAKDFGTLRQYQGLSGFQKRKESVHDVWEAGHSSTSLSAALGMAVARDFKNENYEIVPVIGDGAIVSGMALEALNSIGSEKRHMIIVFNDNNMSISRNVGAMSKGFARLRSGKSYNSFKKNLKDSLRKNEFGKVMYSGMKTVKDAVKDTVIDQGIFGEFNMEYMGPVDGHNLHDLIQVLNVAKEHEGPVVVHVMTQKGRGYGPCEKDSLGAWHGVGPFDIETGKFIHEVPEGYGSWSSIFSSALVELASKNPKICALTPAMVNGSALEEFFAKYPTRSFDCGIAEEHATTFAGGLAISDLKPVLVIYSSFLQRAYDQINHDICRMDLPVVFGVDRAGLVGADGDTHHGVFDIGILKPLPNVILAQGKNAEELRNLLYTALNQSHPFMLRYPRGEAKLSQAEFKEIPIGSWEVLNEKEGNQLVVFTYGPEVEKILAKIETNNLPVTVVNCRFFKPIDKVTLIRLFNTYKNMIVYETDMKEGGLSSSILEYANFIHENIQLECLGIGDCYVPQGSNTLLKKELHIDINDLFERIEQLLAHD